MQKIILFPSLSFLTPFSFWCTFSFFLYLSSIELRSLYDCYACLYVCMCVRMCVLINVCLYIHLHMLIFFSTWNFFSTGGGGRTGNTLHPKWDSCPLHHCELTQAFPKIVNLNWPVICWHVQANLIIYQIDTIFICEFFSKSQTNYA
jgi:hypothetical protein